jgi:hypothetical protein
MTEVLVVAKKIVPDTTTDAGSVSPAFAIALGRGEPQAAAILPAPKIQS